MYIGYVQKSKYPINIFRVYPTYKNVIDIITRFKNITRLRLTRLKYGNSKLFRDYTC